MKRSVHSSGVPSCPAGTADARPEPVTPIQACLDRLAAGDPAARDDLIRHSRDRLLALVRGQFARYPRLRRWVESEDVLHDALVRLDRALAAVPLATTRDFVGVAAQNVRWALGDLVRHHFGAEGDGANHATPTAGAGGWGPDPAGGRDDPAALAELRELDGLVEALPADERAAVELFYYLGLTQAEAGRALGVCDRTVRLRLRAAEVRLGKLLGAGVPA